MSLRSEEKHDVSALQHNLSKFIICWPSPACQSAWGILPPPEVPVINRRAMLSGYREQLKALIPPLLEKWQRVLGVQVYAWGVKRMKTKWGGCTTNTRRIWLNLELAKTPLQCLEYVVAHELTHLIERNHNERFLGLLDEHLPNWRQVRAVLNKTPLAHQVWD